MNKYKVCVYAICKNEEQFADRWCDSMQEADMLLVCDTGSSDNTAEKLKSRGAVVHEIKVEPWRFDHARNKSLEYIPEDVDICVCTDLDEVFVPGWRIKLENIWTPETTRLKFKFTWKFNKAGQPCLTYWKDRIHSRHGYSWVRPVHEALQYTGEKSEKYAYGPGIVLNHIPDPAKCRRQYLPLLELACRENPSDSSIAFWLGREYMYYGQYDKCIEALKRHLSLPKATWDQERCASSRYIARSYKAKGNLPETKKWLYRAIAECPAIREAYADMLHLGHELKEWALAYHMLEEILKIKNRPFSYLAENSSWDYTIYDTGAIACYKIGLFERSLELAQTAFDMNPGNDRIKRNMQIIKEKVKKKE